MAFVRGILVLSALLVAAATTIEPGHKPSNEHGHGHGHGHPAVVPENPDDHINPDEQPVLDYEGVIPEPETPEGSGEDEITFGLKLHRQRRSLPHNDEDEHEHEHQHEHQHEQELEHSKRSLRQYEEVEEEVGEEDEEEVEKEVEDESGDGITEDDEQTDELENIPVTTEASQAAKQAQWVTCDFPTTPILSCYDCNSRLRCRFNGGRVIPCYSPVKPYCNNGICSAVPSALCTASSYEEQN